MYHLAADLSLFLFCLRPVHVMFFHMPQLVSLLPSTIQSPLDSHMLHHIPFHFRPEKIATYCIFHVISHIQVNVFSFCTIVFQNEADRTLICHTVHF